MRQDLPAKILIKRLLTSVFPERLRVIIYPLFQLRLPINLNSKKSFNAFINRNKIYARFSEVSFTQDKLLAKLWVSWFAPTVTVPKVLAVSESVEGIPFDNLSINTVVKTNHGCGANFVYRGQSYDSVKLKENFGLSLSEIYSQAAVEWSYRHITPKVFVEEMVPSNDQDIDVIELIDYKLFVIFGKVRLIELVFDRSKSTKVDFFTPSWQKLKVQSSYPASSYCVPKPKKLDELILSAESIAAPFSFLRVDFYINSNEIYFGEVAHYPRGGYMIFNPKSFDEELMISAMQNREINSKFFCDNE